MISKAQEVLAKKNKGIFNAIANDKPSDTDLKVINTIKSFPIPNNKEDIMEFMILASSNIDLDAYDSASGGLKNARQEVSNAWVSKMEQAYQKACIICKDDPEFKKIEELYSKTNNKIKFNKSKWQRFCLYLIFFWLLIIFICIIL